jgi:flagellar biosynthesis regulator FlaF
MYQFAYPPIADEFPPQPFLNNFHKLSLAIELLEYAAGADCAGHEQLMALSDFRRLWVSVLATEDTSAWQMAPALNALSESIIEAIDTSRMSAGADFDMPRMQLP